MGEEVHGMTEERSPTPTRYEEDEIDLGEYFAFLRRNGWKIVLFSLAVGLVTLLVMFQFPDIYQATAVLTPAVDEQRPNPALGVLASFGVDIGSPTRVEDLETLSRATTSPCACSGSTTFGRSFFRTSSIPRRGR
jgi:hypothetical protein